MQSKEEFLGFEQQLTQNLEDIEEVIGLIFLGSAADHSRFDEWSDHDFFVVTKEGRAEELRTELSWLPNHQQIVLSPRETAHGLKVIYKDGHVLEFAVFEDSELEKASANSYLVALDKSKTIQTRMNSIAERTRETVAGTSFEPTSTYELLLCQLLIGVGRSRRGEALIAGEHVRSWAIASLVKIFRYWEEPESNHLTDSLNPLRRFEVQYPELGIALVKAQASSVEDCARAILQILLDSKHLSEKQREQAQVIIGRLGW
ncbi:MAG: hypothetical protein NTW23_01270 [Rhodoluna sp.]|nr:hypothetical protein [Rhodoluna sp.]